ncbi:hypothetical protein KSS87_011036 [Heliosperma pusillum]|nr:hypothetical protein KSS87_011036 [Heliosperma pusillum]
MAGVRWWWRWGGGVGGRYGCGLVRVRGAGGGGSRMWWRSVVPVKKVREGGGRNVSDIVSYTSSNVITSQVVIVEANASQSVSEISAIAVEVLVPVTSDVIQNNVVEEVVDEKEAKGSSSNRNRTFDCPIHLKPIIGMVFDKLELGIGFYEAYAKECGFVSRLRSQKVSKDVVTHKACLCNKAGECEAKGTKQRRQSTRISCPARVNFKRIPSGQYQIYAFVEGHNHMPQTPLTMKNKVSELWSELFTCVSVVEQSPVYCDELLGMLRGFKERVLAVTSVIDDSGNSGIGKKMDKNAEIGMLLGTSLPSEIKVLPPRQCKNKGSGKRLISQREKAGEVSKRPLRRCKACGEMANHDSRNCDKKTTDDDDE